MRNNPVNGTDPTGHCYKMINGELAPQCVKYWKDYTAALIKPQIVSRSEWGAHEPGSIPLINGAEFNEGRYSKNNEEGYMPYSEKYPGMTLDEILDTIVIHHTATENDTVLSLQEKEMANGYYDLPYQYVISPDGTIYEGRSIDVRGAHVQDGNTGKIGVALLGDFRSNTPSEAQYQSAVKLAKWLDVKYGIEELGGHNEFNATICPVPNAQTLTDRLKGSFAK